MPADQECDRLISLFNRLFQPGYNTLLVRGGDEPLYLPADSQSPQHRILFAHGYFSSALHEIAHWCVAGAERRLLVDFGYWYRPDGRSAVEQAEFERVEIKPQALEWIFSRACGHRFRISADNTRGDAGDGQWFKREVTRQARDYLQAGLHERPALWVEALASEFGQPLPQWEDFCLDDL